MTPARHKRLRTLLRLIDYRRAGASPRDLAERLIDPAIVSLSAAAWSDATERKRISRWITQAERLVTSGYRDLLHGH